MSLQRSASLLVAGIDVGSSAVKVAVVDDAGEAGARVLVALGAALFARREWLRTGAISRGDAAGDTGDAAALAGGAK